MSSRPTELISLTGSGTRFFVWAYFAVTAILGLWTISDSRSPILPLGALLLYAAACFAITLDRGEKLSLPTTIIAAGVGPLSVLMISWQLRDGGYNAWYIGGAGAILFLVTLRGRILAGWIGCAVLMGVVLLWGVTGPIGLGQALFISARQAAVLAIATLTAVGFRRTARRIGALSVEASVRGAAEAAGRAAASERSVRLAELRRTVVPLLERIGSTASITAEDRQEFATAEAELRDELRARSLRQPRLVEAARDARTRGVDVVLLDDSDPALIPPADLEHFTDVIVTALDTASDGRVTARLLPPGREIMGTVVADGSVYARHEVPPRTEPQHRER